MYLRESPRIRSVAGLAVAVGLGLAGCTSAPASDADVVAAKPSAAQRGVVTEDEAQRILDHYVKVNNAANRTQDAEVLATVEAKTLFQRSSAGYEQFDSLSKEKQKNWDPFFYEDPEFYIPVGTNWFLVVAPIKDSKDTHISIFERSNGQWKAVAGLYEEDKLPEIARNDDGTVATVGEDEKIGFLTPYQVTKAFEDLYVTGGKAAGKVLGDSKAKDMALGVFRDSGRWGGSAEERFATIEPTYPDVYAVRTADGGALAVVPLAHKLILRVKPGFRYEPSATERVYDPSIRSVVIDTFRGSAAAHLPPSGPPRVLGAGYTMTGSS